MVTEQHLRRWLYRWLQCGQLEEAIGFLVRRYQMSDGEAWAWCLELQTVRPWEHRELLR